MKQTTLVLGASENTERYSNKAIRLLQKHNHKVEGIGARAGTVNGLAFSKEKTLFSDIDTVTLYLGEAHQHDYYDYVIALKPRRIIFNPGTENEEFKQLAQAAGIETLEACTLVLLTTGQY